MFACVLQRRWNSCSLKKFCDWFVVCEEIYRLWCFSQNFCKHKNCHVACQRFFRILRYFELFGIDDFWSERHRCIGSPLLLDLLVWVIFTREGVASASEACVSHEDTFIWTVLVVSLLDPILSFLSLVPRGWSVYCFGSNIAFLCGVIYSPTCLTGWVISFWLYFCSIFLLVVVIVFVNIVVVVRDRVIGATVSISKSILGHFQPAFFALPASDNDFCNVQLLYSGGTSVWFCQHSCLFHVSSQC